MTATLTQRPEEYLTYEQVAQEIGVSDRRVSQWVNDGSLEVIRLGHRTARVRRSALNRFLERYLVPA